MKRGQLLGLFFHLCLCFNLTAATERRAAIDIGMGGPELQVAEVDPTTNKIVKMLHTQRYFVNFYEGICDNQLTPEIMEQGIENSGNSQANDYSVSGHKGHHVFL